MNNHFANPFVKRVKELLPRKHHSTNEDIEKAFQQVVIPEHEKALILQAQEKRERKHYKRMQTKIEI